VIWSAVCNQISSGDAINHGLKDETASELGYYRIEDDGPLILTVSDLLTADGRRLALEFYRLPGQ
jgi:hypothetical protein